MTEHEKIIAEMQEVIDAIAEWQKKSDAILEKIAMLNGWQKSDVPL